MTEIVIDKKKYILISEKDYQVLRKKITEKTFSINKARAYSKKLIRKWAAEK